MLNEIKGFQFIKDDEHCMSQETKVETEVMLRWLVYWCLGNAFYVKNPKSECAGCLNLWVMKMTKAGWNRDRINKMVSMMLHSKEKFWSSDISLEALMSGGIDIVDETGNIINELQLKEYEDQKEKIISKFTVIQNEYYNLLFDRGLSITQVSRIMGKDKSTVSHMKTTLENLLKPLSENIPPIAEDKEITLTEKILIEPEEKKRIECPFCHSEDIVKDKGKFSKCNKCGTGFESKG